MPRAWHQFPKAFVGHVVKWCSEGWIEWTARWHMQTPLRLEGALHLLGEWHEAIGDCVALNFGHYGEQEDWLMGRYCAFMFVAVEPPHRSYPIKYRRVVSPVGVWVGYGAKSWVDSTQFLSNRLALHIPRRGVGRRVAQLRLRPS